MFFESQEWEDLRREVSQALKNADDKIHLPYCEKRDIWVGKYLGIKEILDLEKQYRR